MDGAEILNMTYAGLYDQSPACLSPNSAAAMLPFLFALSPQ